MIQRYRDIEKPLGWLGCSYIRDVAFQQDTYLSNASVFLGSKLVQAANYAPIIKGLKVCFATATNTLHQSSTMIEEIKNLASTPKGLASLLLPPLIGYYVYKSANDYNKNKNKTRDLPPIKLTMDEFKMLETNTMLQCES